jgi:Flp pilus assembly protein TadB
MDPTTLEGDVTPPVLASVWAGVGVGLLVGARRAALLERVRLPVRPDIPDPASDRPWSIWLRRLGGMRWLRRAAGLPGSDDRPSEQLAVAAMVGGATAIALLLVPLPGPALVPVVLLVALRVPRFLDARAIRTRQRAVDAEITQFLDALAAASTAGLSAPLGMRRAAEVVRGPFREDLEAALRSVDLGARWRDELRGVAEQADLPDLRRAVAVITRTETLGSSLATSTIDLADRVRAGRRQRATERARTAPVKMLFPLVFLVLPAFLLLTVVPVLLTTLQSIR